MMALYLFGLNTQLDICHYQSILHDALLEVPDELHCASPPVLGLQRDPSELPRSLQVDRVSSRLSTGMERRNVSQGWETFPHGTFPHVQIWYGSLTCSVMKPFFMRPFPHETFPHT